MSRFWRTILFGLLAAVALLVLGGTFSAGGHDFALIKVFFPWAMIMASLSPYFAWWLPFLSLAFAQFPFYGIVAGPRRGRASAFWGALVLIALFHTAGVVWCFVLDDA